MRIFASLCFIVASGMSSFGWVYPEHRSIGILAIEKLSPEERKILNQLWTIARKGYEHRLTESIIDPSQGTNPTHLDYAAWIAIAGDHSRSPQDMMYNILQTAWIMRVAHIAAELKNDLQRARNASQFTNALRDSDIKLQRADEDYATRAGKSNVHFLLARKEANITFHDYLAYCVKDSTALNAISAYAWFHALAVKKLSRYNHQTSDQEKSKLALAALADEAFALHFLQDMFSAGHAAGTWGNASMRKGTHDYYNEKGIEVVTWDGTRMTLRGDAFMRANDAEVASNIIQLSISQLIATLNQSEEKNSDQTVSLLPDTLDVGKYISLPKTKSVKTESIQSIIIKTPVPGLASGVGALPRFRSELGPFVGISTSFIMSNINGGFGLNQETPGAIAGIEGDVRFGYGLEGVLNKSGDGLVFVELGWRQDSQSTNQTVDTPAANASSITSAIPGRAGYNVRLRMPYWLIPGDLLLAAPILRVASKKKLTQMVVTSVNGGVIPWQSCINTPIGKFQFVLGREVGVSLYGLVGTPDALIINDSNNKVYFVKYQSTKFEFPILEYRFQRSFSFDQTSSLYMQFSFGVDVPHKTQIISPLDGTDISLKPVWFISTRLLFNWRHYF